MTNFKEIQEQLQKPFTNKEIKYKVQSAGYTDKNTYVIIVPYIDARDIQRRFDEVVGWENWETHYKEINNGFICTIKLTINDKVIEKQDGSEYTKGVIGHEIKGGFSESFKRCASAGYGVGRHLYDMKEEYADIKFQSTNGYEKIWIKEKGNPKNGKFVWWKRKNILDDKRNNELKETIIIDDKRNNELKETIIVSDKCNESLINKVHKTLGKNEINIKKNNKKLSEKVQKLYNLLIEEANQNEEKCIELLEKYTSFNSTNGKKVKGATDFYKISEKWAEYTLNKINNVNGGM